jgi:hypothetical protein
VAVENVTSSLIESAGGCMRYIKFHAVLLALIVQTITGCGGGGGDTGTVIVQPTTKTATLKFFSQSSNPADLIGGFKLTVTLPVGSSIPTDASGVPLSSAVYLSGQFAGGTSLSPICLYEPALRKLTVTYASASSYQLGEFITILVTVPSGYVPNPSDINYLPLEAYAPLTGVLLPTITATATFI